MKKLAAYKFRIYPTKKQQTLIEDYARSCRYIYNRCLSINEKRYASRKSRKEAGDTSVQEDDKYLSRFDMGYFIKPWRNDPETKWLAACPHDALSGSLLALDRAFKKFFKNQGGYPKYHNASAGIRYAQKANRGTRFDPEARTIAVPKVGVVKCRGWKTIEGKIKNISVSSHGGRWFCSLQTEVEVADPVHSSEKYVGIDRGVVSMVVLSDGYTPVEGVERYQSSVTKIERRLEAMQRKLSRQQGPDRRNKATVSNRWKVQKQKIAKLHNRLADIRNNHLHNVSHSITQKYSAIALEDLNVKAMTESAKGTAKAHGNNVVAKSKLNRSILRQGWGELERQIIYKSAWKGGRVIKVDPRNTSRQCSDCGHTSKDNRKSQDRFVCQSCGMRMNADLNAAINIRDRAFGIEQPNLKVA